MMNAKVIDEIEAFVNLSFDKDSHRLKHIYNVKKVAVALGKIYHVDIPSVVVASYLHDVTKHYSFAENKALLGNIFDESIPKPCLHAYSASVLAKTRFEIDDLDILNAIKYHCSGRSEMSLLEKIIFVSDYIEESRTFVTDELRTLAKVNLDLTVYKILVQTKEYILSKHQTFSNLSEEAINYYQQKMEELND